MKKRTFCDRIAQLGNIALIEAELMNIRNEHGIMPRTKKAKAILLTLFNQDGEQRDLNTKNYGI